LITIKQLLGHSSVATTQIYTQVAGTHLEDAIHLLNQKPAGKSKEDKAAKNDKMPPEEFQKILDMISNI